LFAALLLGIAVVVGKYYVPQAGAFIIYAVTVAVLYVRPQGLMIR
jgi:branched-chain amino acid transport system permease protein